MTVERYKWGTQGTPAADTSYDNSTSGLAATTVQGAIDEVATDLAAASYYVELAGSDSNDGLTPLTAFLTIQHAVDVVSSKRINVPVTIRVGIGTFNAFTISKPLATYASGSLTIQGTLVFAPGGSAGIATDGTNTTLIDAGANWTSNQYAGKILLDVNNDCRYYIISNSQTTLLVIGWNSATFNVCDYNILEHATTIKPLQSEGIVADDSVALKYLEIDPNDVYSAVALTNGYFSLDTVSILPNADTVYGIYAAACARVDIATLKIDALTSGEGIYFWDVDACYSFNNIWISYCAFGIYIALSYLETTANFVYVYGCPYGISLINCSKVYMDGPTYVLHGTYEAIDIQACSKYTRFNNVTIDDATIGFNIDSDTNHQSGGSLVYIDTAAITTCSVGAVYAHNRCNVYLKDVTGSTGNAGVGIRAGLGATVSLNRNGTSVTGVLGNFTVDHGAHYKTYAGDLAANGSIVTNANEFTNVIRRDSFSKLITT